tara:strand:+ start:342 stop:845 length:504 start_codon:yes stop_codon:yes gene_type:complete
LGSSKRPKIATPREMTTYIIKEKRGASSLEAPRDSKADIVKPDRDTPGITASPCATPVKTTSKKVRSVAFVFGPERGANQRNSPVAINANETGIGELSFSKTSCRPRPRKTVGIDAKRTRIDKAHPSVALLRGDERPTRKPVIAKDTSRRRKTRTARRVPVLVAISM